MRVLDIATGAGDVAFIAAKFVGPSGHVLGLDRNPDAIARAKHRNKGSVRAGWTEFRTGSLSDLDPDQMFDLVIGRFVLAFQPDPATFLRQAAERVRPGGAIAFLEPALKNDSSTRSIPTVPLWESTMDLVSKAFRSAGTRDDQGYQLVNTFFHAGLSEPTLVCDALMGGPGMSPIVKWACLTLQSLLPQLEKIGAATAPDLEFDTLEARLRDATSAAHSQLIFYAAIGAWARLGRK